MVPHVALIGSEKYKVPKDLVIKSSELFFFFLRERNKLPSDVPSLFTIVFVSPGEILYYNKTFRNKNVSTDVLSFYTDREFSYMVGEKKRELVKKDLGDIIICKDVVEQNAIRFRVSAEEELIRVTIHGILHLLGFNHEGLLGSSSEELFVLQEDFIKVLKRKGFIK